MVIETDWPNLRKRIVKHVTVFDVLKKERKMKIKMLRDLDVAFDGNTLERLEEGEKYDIPESFANRYLAKGIAVKVEEKAKPAAPENRAKGPAPENKARTYPKRKRK